MAAQPAPRGSQQRSRRSDNMQAEARSTGMASLHGKSKGSRAWPPARWLGCSRGRDSVHVQFAKGRGMYRTSPGVLLASQPSATAFDMLRTPSLSVPRTYPPSL
jgi:hypothetical protein